MDKQGNGIVSRRNIYWLMKKYTAVVAGGVDIMKLIQTCDRNHDHILDASEIHELL